MISIFTLNSNNFGDGINKLFWEYITQNKIYNNRIVSKRNHTYQEQDIPVQFKPNPN